MQGKSSNTGKLHVSLARILSLKMRRPHRQQNTTWRCAVRFADMNVRFERSICMIDSHVRICFLFECRFWCYIIVMCDLRCSFAWQICMFASYIDLHRSASYIWNLRFGRQGVQHVGLAAAGATSVSPAQSAWRLGVMKQMITADFWSIGLNGCFFLNLPGNLLSKQDDRYKDFVGGKLLKQQCWEFDPLNQCRPTM